MASHAGVTCDVCNKYNFAGDRYKCLACYDYDLCETCFDDKATSQNHEVDHPMQCILTRNDFERHNGKKEATSGYVTSYTCPFCGEDGHESESRLLDHIVIEHDNSDGEQVVCPVCAATPHGDPNFLTDTFASHLAMEHCGGCEYIG
ncbi:E3 ubiquitin-protein ligase KCMF1-like [Oscarella lobularis]|uniref:E3 ubiquitin-protein ligase KCMF1-like n=1 Tax=Oscarella lobularis TaxID=121494 RepID=UPI003313BA94